MEWALMNIYIYICIEHLFVVDSGHNAEKMQVDGVNTACPEKQLWLSVLHSDHL